MEVAAAQLRSLEQTRVSPKLLEQMMSSMPSSPAQPASGSSQDPVLQKLLAPIREHKQRGAGLFKGCDVAGALAAYQAAVVAAGGTTGQISPPRTRLLVWPLAEPLVFACQSNAALCLLQLGRPAEAVAACDAALLMPSADGPSSALLSKVLVRKLQGLIDDAFARMRSPGEHAGPHPLERILQYLDELRRRGCFGGDNQRGTTAPPLPALLEQVARMRLGEANAARSIAERAFAVLTERWVATALLEAARLDAATARIAAADGAARDATVLCELAELAVPAGFG